MSGWGPVAGRDLYSLIDSTVHGYACPAPPTVGQSKPQVIRLQPTMCHAGGLYPMDLKGVRFVVPCVLSPTGWVRRKLTGTEMYLN